MPPSRALAGLLAAGLLWAALPAAGVSSAVAIRGAGRADAGCSLVDQPFAGLPGADLTPTVHTSEDASPVRYVQWRGVVPSFDGLPLSVDVAVPCDGRAEGGAARPRPTMVMAHGFTDDKTVWEETGKSDSVVSEDRPGANTRWNDIWFASRGYVVVTYTARGWRDSCGPDTPGMGGGAVAPQCAGHKYWIHLDDQRWEVRDAQWLTGSLVQSGTADPDRLAITGGSYGGGPASMAALLGDRLVCGADAVPPELGADPCAGRGDGDLAPWTTPDGERRLRWAAAVPMYTFADLLQVLAPNGRWSDGWEHAPSGGSSTRPVGVPLASTISGLLLAARTFGSLAPPGTDPSSDIAASTDRLLAGPPYPPDEPAVAEGIREYERFKSPVGIEPSVRVPIFWVHGFTDALFPASEALTFVAHVMAADPNYPIKVFLGDLGHDYAAERTDEWDAAKQQMNAFVDHYLRPDRTPEAPTFDVSATITRCLDPDAPMRIERARTWDALHPDRLDFHTTGEQQTSTATPGPAGAATDPISTATLPGPDSYKGCRIMAPSEPDPTVATYEYPIDEDVVLLGAPVIDLRFDATGPDAPIAVRVWDVDRAGRRQGLVTRGVHRAGAAGEGQRARFQIAPQGYRFRAGHRLKVEVTANDSPYLLSAGPPAEVTVRRFAISLPVHPARSEQEAGPDAAQAGDVVDPSGAPSRSGTVAAFAIAALAVLAAALVWFARRSRAQHRPERQT